MRALILILVLLAADRAIAAPTWVDWQSPTSASSITGLLGPVTVTLTGPLNPTPFVGAVGEPSYWTAFPASYSTATIPPPTTSDMIRLTGGVGTGIYTLTFSQPVTNPVMAIASLGGASAVRTQFVFDTPYTILTTGQPGYWGTGTPLRQTGLVLDGMESNGLIQFQGTVSTITWTLPFAESWFGLTVGADVPVTAPPAPGIAAGLAWDYPTEPPESVADGFRLYRGIGPVCDAPNPLPDQVMNAVPRASLTAIDNAIPVTQGTVCYEVTAYNVAGESERSNRASALVETLIPAQPQGVQVLAVPGARE